MTVPDLQSATYELRDALEVHELYQQQGWTDGLPIVPPHGGAGVGMSAGHGRT